MEWGIGCCCQSGYVVGFWSTLSQIIWQVDFPSTWTKRYNRDAYNLSSCNVLVIGKATFASSVQPDTVDDCNAVASWIDGGGVLFVLHEYYGPPSPYTSSQATALNICLARLGTQARCVLTSGPTGVLERTYSVASAHPVMAGVDLLSSAAPGYMNTGTAEVVFYPSGVSAITVEPYGSGFVVFVADANIVNLFDPVENAISGNKVTTFLSNLGAISTN